MSVGRARHGVVPEETVFPPFRVSEAAVSQIVAVGGSVRIDIAAGGCCGRKYVFTADRPDAGDQVFGCPGAALALSPVALATMTGARLDYGARLKPPRFRVLANPNTPLRCPCSRSFGAEWPGSGQPDCQSYVPMPWD
jgi:iron-sulfur cluster assembly accessory protein